VAAGSTAGFSSQRRGRPRASGRPIRTGTRRCPRPRPSSSGPAAGPAPGAGGGAARWPAPWPCCSLPPWPGRGSRSARPGTTPAGSAPLPSRRGSPGRARRWRSPTRSPRRCSPGPHGGSRRPRRRGTACSSRWLSRCAASCPPVRAR
jgi:hypothetical protein